MRLGYSYTTRNIVTNVTFCPYILPTYVASGAAVIIRAVAEETVHLIFTLSVIHARITGALVNVCDKKQRRCTRPREIYIASCSDDQVRTTYSVIHNAKTIQQDSDLNTNITRFVHLNVIAKLKCLFTPLLTIVAVGASVAGHTQTSIVVYQVLARAAVHARHVCTVVNICTDTNTCR